MEPQPVQGFESRQDPALATVGGAPDGDALPDGMVRRVALPSSDQPMRSIPVRPATRCARAGRARSTSIATAGSPERALPDTDGCMAGMSLATPAISLFMVRSPLRMA